MAADNVITYLLELEDEVSAGLRLTSKRADELEKELARLKTQLKGTSKAQKQSGNFAIVQAQGMRVAKAAVAGLTVAVTALGVGYGKMGRDAIGTAAQLEKFETRLGGLLNDMDLGKARVKELFDISARTPFQIAGLVEAETTLEAFGVNAPRVRDGVMDLAGAMGLDLVEAARGVGKALSAGAGAADVLRERGVIGMVEMQAGMAVTAMTTEQFRNALMNTLETNEKLVGGTARLAGTFSGLMSTLSDQFTGFSKQVADSQLFEAAKLVLIDILRVLGENKKRTGELAGVVGGQLTGALLGVAEHFGFIIGLGARFARLFNTFAGIGIGFNAIMSELKGAWIAFTIAVGKAGVAIKKTLGMDTEEREASVQQMERVQRGHQYEYRLLIAKNDKLKEQRKHLDDLVDGFEGTGLAVDEIRKKLADLADVEVDVTVDQADDDAIMTIVGIDKAAAKEAATAAKEAEKAAKAAAKASAQAASHIQKFNGEVWGLSKSFSETAQAMAKPKTAIQEIQSTLIEMSGAFLRAEATAKQLGPTGEAAFAQVKDGMIANLNAVSVATAAAVEQAERQAKAGAVGGAMSGAADIMGGGMGMLAGAGPVGAGAGALIGVGQQGAAAYESAIEEEAAKAAKKRQAELAKRREKAERAGFSEDELAAQGLGKEDIARAGQVTAADKAIAAEGVDRGEIMGQQVAGAVKGVIEGIRSIIKGLPSILTELIPLLLIELPTAIINSIPDMVEALIPILLFELPKALIMMVVKLVPRLFTMFFTRLIPAMIMGIGRALAKWWKAIKSFFTIGGSKQTGGFIPKTDAYLLHQGERVVPSSGAGTGTASKGLAAFAGAGTNLTINTNVVNPDSIPELSRLIDREMGANGRATVPLWGSGSAVRSI